MLKEIKIVRYTAICQMEMVKCKQYTRDYFEANFSKLGNSPKVIETS